MNEDIKLLKTAIEKAKHIVFFGGAGVSTESGIKDFRSKDGLYNLHSKYGVSYETMLSATYFYEHTETFYQFYKEFMCKTDAKPNFAHYFLAELEKKGKDITVITQNIDGLHQEAGSKKVIELHGSIKRNYCQKCHAYYDLESILSKNGIPYCDKCKGIIKPDVVLYEEALNQENIQNAILAISNADLLIIAGTSLRVYPANGLINYFPSDNIFVINKEQIYPNRKIKAEINNKVGETFKIISQMNLTFKI